MALDQCGSCLKLGGGKRHKIQGQLAQFQFLKSGRKNNQTLSEHLQD